MINLFKQTNKEPTNLKGILRRLERLQKEHENISHELEELKKESQKSLQKLGIVRFNPFQEVGGEQSFSIALLDAANNGFVLTSHYGRETNRVYAKPITQGQSKYQLSEEEKKAIDEALAQGKK